MRIFLDTHILVFASNGTISQARRALIEEEQNEILFSAISLWEISKLVAKERLRASQGLKNYLEQIETHPKYQLIHLSSGLLSKMIEIAPKMHKDPADQIIVASAIYTSSLLMTDDKEIRSYELIETL